MADILLASAYMSESAVDNGAAFNSFLTDAANQGKIAVIDGKYDIQTPQVFTGLPQFTIQSSVPNKVDKGQGPELNYTGPTTSGALFTFVGCANFSKWGVDPYGVTINCGGNCRYGIRMHTASQAGEHTYSNASWRFENVFINWCGDGGAGVRLTGDWNNDSHVFYRHGGYPGHHIKGVKTVTIANAGSTFTAGTYDDVLLTSYTGSGSWARAKIVVSGGVITSVTITNTGWNYAVGNTLSIDTKQANTTNQGLANKNTALVTKAQFTVASIITDQTRYSGTDDILGSVFTNNVASYNPGWSNGSSIQSLADYVKKDSLTSGMWIDGPANGITAAPTSGTWSTGQHILNWTAAAGYNATTIGWVCTAGGTPGTWIALTSLGAYGLGDPHKGAAAIEVDNPNSVKIESRNSQYGMGAQAIRNIKGLFFLYSTNFGPNVDADIYAGTQGTWLDGGWTEQSRKFIFESFANGSSGVRVSNFHIASYPWTFNGQQGYTNTLTTNINPMDFAPIVSSRNVGLKVNSCDLTKVTYTGEPAFPMQLCVLATGSNTEPPNWSVTNCTASIKGFYDSNKADVVQSTPNLVVWNRLWGDAKTKI